MERPSTLLLLDVDHFKSINDTYGHPVGDDVLRAISQICGTSVRHSDIVGRLGGEEFAIFLPGTSQENAMNLAKRLRERLDSFIVCHQGRRVPFTASIGVASSGPDDDINSLMREADRALYAAKRNGRNRVEVRWLTAFSQV
jgi:diguanylate cyclase (GGDEF)-like protein